MTNGAEIPASASDADGVAGTVLPATAPSTLTSTSDGVVVTRMTDDTRSSVSVTSEAVPATAVMFWVAGEYPDCAADTT